MGRYRVVLSLAVLSLLMTTIPARAFGAAECGEPVPPPKYQAGERWTWRDRAGRQATQEIIQVQGDITQFKWANGDLAFYDKDWVLQKVVRRNGEIITKQNATGYTTVGQKTLDFPLQVGKRWEVICYASPVTQGRGTPRCYHRYRVVACEEVSTLAGKFSALKLEIEQGPTGNQCSGMCRVWYAPRIKNMVRREFVPSPQSSDAGFLDNELIRFTVK